MNRMEKQKGSITMFALMSMVFLGIVVVSLLPMMTQEIKASSVDRDAMEAVYVAEAGIKHAFVAINQKVPVPDQPIIFANDSKKYYQITITGTGPYSITSTGTVNSTQKEITVTYP